MKIDNAQLHAFVTVVREGSFEAAARVLCVTPSAVSQRIRLLEERICQVLIQRASPCRPSLAGQALARHGEQVALLEAEALRELGEGGTRGRAAIRLPVSVNADSLDSWFLAALGALAVHDGLRIDIRVHDQDHTATLLREGALVAAVTTDDRPVAGCRVEALGVMRYLALAALAFAMRHFNACVDGRALAAAPALTFNAVGTLQVRFAQQMGGEAGGDGCALSTHYLPSAAGFVEACRSGLG
jgi:LysR family transcriptional regulator (chromosome initiation inhibitor)